ncbi:MAG: ATP-binding protein, partial [Methylococcales bacterium]|nr:ATP-binding protein [Methylococcales bacterium]
DNAPTIEKENIRSRDLDDIRPGGLGVYFIHEIMDQVEYLENPKGTGNVLQMKKRLELHK